MDDESLRRAWPTAVVAHTAAFPLSGRGDHPAWRAAITHGLQRAAGPGDFSSGVKWLWSDEGLYVLLVTDDGRLACQRHADFDDLTDGDVFVVALRPDCRRPAELEFQISPLGAATLALVTRAGNGTVARWRPWPYGGRRAVRKLVTVRGGPAEPGASVAGWTAEAFFPWELFQGLGACPPEAERWGANVFRIDHDGAAPSWRIWSPAAGDVAGGDGGRLIFAPVRPVPVG